MTKQQNNKNKKESDMILFNFRKNWHKVKPFLFDKDVQDALNSAMNDFMENEIEELKELNIEYDIKRFTWTPGTAPYLMTRSDYWCDKRKPKDYSVGWYQCFHACHWLAEFLSVLGEKMYPELEWMPCGNERHSVAMGFKNNVSYMIFDILNFETMPLEQIMDFVNENIEDEEYYAKYGE